MMTAALNLGSLAQFPPGRSELRGGRRGHRASGLAGTARARPAEFEHTVCSLVRNFAGDRTLPLLGNWRLPTRWLTTTVRDYDAGFMGAVHLCGVVGDRGRGLASSGNRILAFAPAPQELVPVDVGVLDPCCGRLWRSSRLLGPATLRIRSLAGTDRDRFQRARWW